MCNLSLSHVLGDHRILYVRVIVLKVIVLKLAVAGETTSPRIDRPRVGFSDEATREGFGRGGVETPTLLQGHSRDSYRTNEKYFGY